MTDFGHVEGFFDIRYHAGSRWTLLHEVRYILPTRSDGVVEWVTVPEGFETDLASIPFFLRWGLSPSGAIAPGAIVHDKLYRAPVIQTYTPGPDLLSSRPCTYDEANLILWRLCRLEGLDRVRSAAVYQAVSLGGYLAGFNRAV